MNTVCYPTFDAIDMDRFAAVNAGQGCWYNYKMGYPLTHLDVPVLAECPCCHKVMATNTEPIISVNNADKHDDTDFQECNAVSVYRCSSCNNLFSVYSHHVLAEPSNLDVNIYDDDCDAKYSCEVVSSPATPVLLSFSDDVCSLSSEFVEIYHQSEQAEAAGLFTICGMGYRRSLEFLIDAYARHKNPSVSINGSLALGKKIENYINDNRIKTLAARTAWLGNDATHIVNQHPDRDVADMKKFIKAIVYFIDSDFALSDAESIEHG